MAKRKSATVKNLVTDTIVADENTAVATLTERRAKQVDTLKASINITSKGDHAKFLAWRLDEMPDMYAGQAIHTPTGYNVFVLFDDTDPQRTYFATRYLASLVGEIRTLDESNLKIERIPADDEIVG
jgi:hypothetical protein